MTMMRVGLFVASACWRLSVSAEVVTIPLIPHHVQKARRLVSEPDEERPHFYDRSLSFLGTGSRTVESSSETANQVSKVFEGYGTHYADLWVGTPPQRQTVIIDTGSGYIAFPCSSCAHCGVPEYHASLLFHQENSQTFSFQKCGKCSSMSQCELGSCRVKALYGEGSFWYAKEAEDVCYVGGSHYHALDGSNSQNDLDPAVAADNAFNMVFGCQDIITGLFIPQLADGIMGMDKDRSSLPQQMFQQGKISSKSFSLCFGRALEIDRDGSQAGSMSLGGIDTRLHSTPMVYSEPAHVHSLWYQVNIRKVYVREGGAGTSVRPNKDRTKIIPLSISTEAIDKINRDGVIVDSGTTDTFLNHAIGAAFYPLYQELTGSDYEHAWKKMTPEDLDKLPTLLIQLRGDIERNKAVAGGQQGTTHGLVGKLDPDNPYDVLLAVPPIHYHEYRQDKAMYANRLFADSSGMSILGANVMLGHDIHFDLESNVFGWAESDCDYNSLMESHYEGEYPDLWDEPLHEGLSRDHDNLFCTSFFCQFSSTALMLGLMLLVSHLFATKPSRNGQYNGNLTNLEMEMQTPPSAMHENFGESDDL